MANIMTKRGNQDNVITYEHICDTAADMANIEPQYKTLGSVCIVIKGESGGLEVYMMGSNKQWVSITEVVSSGSGSSTEIDLSDYAPLDSPEFLNSISLNRKSGTTAGDDSIAVGYHTASNGDYSAAFGRDTAANGTSSFAGGEGTIAAGGQEVVIGGYNVLPAAAWEANKAYAQNDYVVYNDKLYYCASAHTSAATFEQDSGWYHARKNLFTVGGGNNASNRANAYTIDLQGNGRYKGNVYVECNSDSSGGTKLEPLPAVTSSDEGKVLTVNSSGAWAAAMANNGIFIIGITQDQEYLIMDKTWKEIDDAVKAHKLVIGEIYDTYEGGYETEIMLLDQYSKYENSYKVRMFNTSGGSEFVASSENDYPIF